jgi:hypothetical protein
MPMRWLVALAGCAAAGLAGAVPAFTADSGKVTVSITATAPEAPAPCLTVSPSGVDFGSHPFSRPDHGEVDERTVTVTSCATGGASERVSVVGTDPTGPTGTWTLASAQETFCPAVDRLSLELDRLAGGDQVAQTVTTSAGFLPVTWAPDEAKDFRLVLVMPCQGSHGAGETRTTEITFTAVVP